MRSPDTILMLHAVKQLHIRMEQLHAEMQDLKQQFDRVEQHGITLHIESDSDSEESEASQHSAPF